MTRRQGPRDGNVWLPFNRHSFPKLFPAHYAAAGNAASACHSFPLHPQFQRANRSGGNHAEHRHPCVGRGARSDVGRRIPDAGHAYTPEEQAACQPDAFRLCGSEIPNIERVKACMVAKRAQLSPECKRFFRSDPPEPVAVTPAACGQAGQRQAQDDEAGKAGCHQARIHETNIREEAREPEGQEAGQARRDLIAAYRLRTRGLPFVREARSGLARCTRNV